MLWVNWHAFSLPIVPRSQGDQNFWRQFQHFLAAWLLIGHSFFMKPKEHSKGHVMSYLIDAFKCPFFLFLCIVLQTMLPLVI